MEKELLFSKYKLSEFFKRNEQNAITAIENFNADKLLNLKTDDLALYFFNEFCIEPIQLLEEKITIDDKEVKVDVSQDQNRYVSNRSIPFFIDAFEYIYFIPFSGNVYLLKCQPSKFNFNPPRANLINNEIQISYTIFNNNSDEIKDLFNYDLGNLKNYLKYEEDDIKSYNINLKSNIVNHLNYRRQRVLNNKGIVESLGYPLKRTAIDDKTLSIPIIRKKINLLPAVSVEKFSPEPILDDEIYNQILEVISNMVLVMERSPHAFQNMDEEDIRQHFLVQLNGQFEGKATGETFNFQGKTDILIRVDGKNIFIAECKFWTGKKGLLDAVDQLLNYLTWRDTKTAILIFNKNKNFSQVVTSIPDIIKTHPNHKKTIELNGTTSKFIFRQKDDLTREIILSVLAFDIPKNELII